jgi:Flp pilus assembly protein TadG
MERIGYMSRSMSRPFAKSLRRCARHAACFGAARRGATAVEFALIAPAFFALLIAIFETTIFLFAQQNLQDAAVEAGRLFMTGQAQKSSMTQAQFKTNVCQIIQALFNCNSLMINVQSYNSFSAANTSEPTLTYNAQGQVNNGAYSPGTPGQVTVVQLAYPWHVIGGPLGFSLANQSNGTAEMMGVTAFRVEPY